jgi:hypothetical protein
MNIASPTHTFTFAAAPRIAKEVHRGFIGEQLWVIVRPHSIQWAMPIGYPNNQVPICEEVDPEGFTRIAEAIGYR